MTYQKPDVRYGSVPYGNSPVSSNNDDDIPPSTKRTTKSIIVKCAILTATLIGGILIGSAISGYSESWVEEREDAQVKQQQQQQPVVVAPVPAPAPAVSCDQPDKKVDTEAEVWAKIKQNSLGT